MATHPGILDWKIPRAEEPGRLHSVGHKELDRLKTHTHTHTQPWESVRKCPWCLNIKWGMAREATGHVRLV